MVQGVCRERGSSVKETCEDGTRTVQGVWRMHAVSVQGARKERGRSMQGTCKNGAEKCARREFTELMARG